MHDILGLIFRGAERLIIVSAAFVSIWLGYKLFSLIINEKGNFEGSIGKWNIKLQRIAPGVFFALFGAAILIFSLNKPYEYVENSNSKNQSDQNPAKIYYLNENTITSDSEEAKKILLAISVYRKILNKNTSIIDDNDKNLIAINQPILDRFRIELIDKAFSEGSAKWYFDKHAAYIASNNNMSGFTPDEAEKFKIIHSYMTAN